MACGLCSTRRFGLARCASTALKNFTNPKTICRSSVEPAIAEHAIAKHLSAKSIEGPMASSIGSPHRAFDDGTVTCETETRGASLRRTIVVDGKAQTHSNTLKHNQTQSPPSETDDGDVRRSELCFARFDSHVLSGMSCGLSRSKPARSFTCTHNLSGCS